MSGTNLMPIAGIVRRESLTDKPIRIGILEDDPDMRGYLATLIRAEPDMELEFASARLAEARSELARAVPDLCLVDIRLPDGSGLDFLTEAMRRGAKALILTVLGDRSSVLLAFELGANGYLLKDTAPDQIKANIRAVISGGVPISPQAATHVLALSKGMMSSPGANPATDSLLTVRESEVLHMFARGLSYRETAETMGLSVHTVSDHVKAIYSKLGVHSRNEAVYEAVQNGWLEL